MEGFIYVMSNPAMPGLVKIGMTAKMPHLRAAEISAHEGLPSKMKLEYYALVTGDPRIVEQHVHWHLNACHAGKEWFHCEGSTAIAGIKQVAANKIQHEKFINAEQVVVDKEDKHQFRQAAEAQEKLKSAQAEIEEREQTIERLLADFYRLEPLAREAYLRYDGLVRRLVDTFNPALLVKEFRGKPGVVQHLEKCPLSDILLLNQYNAARYLLSKAGRLPEKGWLERELKTDYFEVPSFVIDEFRRRLNAATDKKPFYDSCYPEIRNWYGFRS